MSFPILTLVIIYITGITCNKNIFYYFGVQFQANRLKSASVIYLKALQAENYPERSNILFCYR